MSNKLLEKHLDLYSSQLKTRKLWNILILFLLTISFLISSTIIDFNFSNIVNSRRLEGASTITQQVAKNFLLTSDVSLSRKIKEAILEFRIEKTLSKQRILELYLNEIY